MLVLVAQPLAFPAQDLPLQVQPPMSAVRSSAWSGGVPVPMSCRRTLPGAVGRGHLDLRALPRLMIFVTVGDSRVFVRVIQVVMTPQIRAVMARPAFCGVPEWLLGELVTELAARWEARCESERHDRRQGSRRREAGAGPKYELVFTDRLLATPVHLRTGLTYEALGVIYQVGKSTIGRAVAEVRPLLAARGFAVPQSPGLRLLTLQDVFAYAEAEGVTLRIHGMETQVRRPKAHQPGRRAFVSGKRKQNTIKTTTISDGQGRTVWSGEVRLGRMHDQTCVRTEGIAEQFRLHTGVKAEVDDGYRGLANEFPNQISAPPRRPKDLDDLPVTEYYGWRERKHRQSSRRICVEHANAEHRQPNTASGIRSRDTGRRDTYGDGRPGGLIGIWLPAESPQGV